MGSVRSATSSVHGGTEVQPLLPPSPVSSRAAGLRSGDQAAASSPRSANRSPRPLRVAGEDETQGNEPQAQELLDPPVVVVSPSRTFGGALGYEELQALDPRPRTVSSLD